MSRMVKDFIEIKDCTSLDAFIDQLVAVRDSLPSATDAQIKMRGDDVFGRKLSVSYFRPQTDEEAECDARYAESYRAQREREMSKLHEELGFCPVPHRARLRIVA